MATAIAKDESTEDPVRLTGYGRRTRTKLRLSHAAMHSPCLMWVIKSPQLLQSPRRDLLRQLTRARRGGDRRAGASSSATGVPQKPVATAGAGDESCGPRPAITRLSNAPSIVVA